MAVYLSKGNHQKVKRVGVAWKPLVSRLSEPTPAAKTDLRLAERDLKAKVVRVQYVGGVTVQRSHPPRLPGFVGCQDRLGK